MKEKIVKNNKPVIEEQAVRVTGSAVRRNVYSSPQKARLVADLVRGKKLLEARGCLTVLNKKIASDFVKAIDTAMNDAIQKYKTVDENKMIISDVMVGEGRKIKGWVLGAKGRAGKKVRRFCHIYLTLAEGK